MKSNIVISVDQLVKRYRNAKQNAVDGVSLTVHEGEFFTMLGPNGAGKTTTISILTTTLSKTSGTIKVAGYDVDTHASEVRRQVGIIFQKPSLDENLTAEENIRLHAILYGLYPFAPTYNFMPADYQQHVNQLANLLNIQNELYQPVKTFSGGMKRKLEIIRSLMHRPKVLFLDEPTTGLDPQSRKNLWSYLIDVRREHQTTIFLTTHYLEEAEEADQICIINQGKVVMQGSPKEIKRHLVKEYVLVDSADRHKLLKELTGKKLSVDGDGPYKIKIDGLTAQDVIQKIATKLSELAIHNPSLEEAYLEIIENKNSESNSQKN